MDLRAEKIAKARQKLKDHQEKKNSSVNKQLNKLTLENKEIKNDYDSVSTAENVLDSYQCNYSNQNNKNNEKESLKETVIFDNNSTNKKTEVNVTEILISTKTTLEMQINKLTEKLTNLETLYRFESVNHEKAKQKILDLEHDLNTLTVKHSIILQDISVKDRSITELKDLISNIKDENNNLMEQLELTKSMLTTKESENTQLQDEIWSYQNKLDVFQLQIQQLTNNFSVNPDQNKTSEQTDKLMKKIYNLEQTIEALQKERDQINSHYEHYVRELNEQIRSEMVKNEGHVKEIQNLYIRENSLIEQISDMEIRLQNFNVKEEEKVFKEETHIDMNKKNQDIQAKLLETNAKYMELEKKYMNSLSKIEELNQVNETECNHTNLSIDKLNADITSDKIAAQRATEQNKKLKSDVIELEQVIIKLGKDKLELTELWTHEKQLNKGLALKLAEVEESLKNMLKQLKAKDDEMIRLQNENRDLEAKCKILLEQLSLTQENKNTKDNIIDHTHNNNNNTRLDQLTTLQSPCLVEIKSSIENLDINNDNRIAKEDAMSKLQERFLNIMDQVANLSDEKHRLEHIILQLQNETDTICEYVALYQQQRNLLKKREEERNNQLKIYEVECNKLKQHLEELQELLLRFVADPELKSFFHEERRRRELSRVRELLEQLHNCALANPRFKNLDLNIFYPCRCCSGKVIDI